MSALQDLEAMISQLSRPEKTQLLQWLTHDLGETFPGIEISPDVLSGEAHIVGTRIPVWELVQARRSGTSEADLLRGYPALRVEDLANAWAYARLHPDDIEQHIASHKTE